jgi:hypothetical protein
VEIQKNIALRDQQYQAKRKKFVAKRFTDYQRWYCCRIKMHGLLSARLSDSNVITGICRMGYFINEERQTNMKWVKQLQLS